MKILYHLLLCSLLFSLSNVLKAQETPETQINGMPLSTIADLVQDSTGVYYYPRLEKKFKAGDKSLQPIDYIMLYYGFSQDERYNPYYHFGLEDSLSELSEAQKGEAALALADQILRENPVSIFANIEKAYVLNALGRQQEAYQHLERYRLLMGAMEASGQGSSYEKAIQIINPKDAQAILLKYKLTELSKSINGQNGRYYDVYLVRNEKGKQYPIYFDITIPRTIGMKKFQEKTSGENSEND